MKISELVKRTGVPKETIHFYIREGLLRKPRKSGVNTADYNENYVEQIQLIKDLRDHHYLPIPEIKKIIKNFKKQSPSDQAISQFHSRYFRPLDRLLSTEIIGEEAFREATGLGRKWLDKMQNWGVITAECQNGKPVYSQDDLIIGRLLVDMDNLGFGPKDGYDPKDLKGVADFIRDYVSSGHNKYLETNLKKLESTDFEEKGSPFTEVMSLFFYYMYRKSVRKHYKQVRKSFGTKEANCRKTICPPKTKIKPTPK
jgi:DNA-binding transcriptional MerR regulator